MARPVFPVPRLAADGRQAEVSSAHGEARDGGKRLHIGVDIVYRRKGRAPAGGTAPNDPHDNDVPNFQGTPGQFDGEGSPLFFAPKGTFILAPEAGEVRRARRVGNGGHVTLFHGDAPSAIDGGNGCDCRHLEQVLVSVGDRVKKGQPIGTMGPGPNSLRHLHFDRRAGMTSSGKLGTRIDPTRYINAATHIRTPSSAQVAFVAAVVGFLAGIAKVLRGGGKGGALA